jgi:holin-like protein
MNLREMEYAMKLIKQLTIIFAFSLLGEVCHVLIPLPIPASIYGMVLLLAALLIKVVKIEAIEEVGQFLVKILPLLFVVPTVALVKHWDLIQPYLIGIIAILVVTTALTFVVSGLLVKLVRKGGEEDA